MGYFPPETLIKFQVRRLGREVIEKWGQSMSMALIPIIYESEGRIFFFFLFLDGLSVIHIELSNKHICRSLILMCMA